MQEEQSKKSYVGYEYKEITVEAGNVPMYVDSYENFGWTLAEEPEERKNPYQMGSHVTIRLKRDRKIINKVELTRLQRNFEGCIRELGMLEREKTLSATIWSLVIGVIGTAFMAGSTFAVTHEPPIIWLCIVLAVPGFIGWILPYFIYQRIRRKKTEELTPLIEQKLDEIDAVCEKGHSLL